MKRLILLCFFNIIANLLSSQNPTTDLTTSTFREAMDSAKIWPNNALHYLNIAQIEAKTETEEVEVRLRRASHFYITGNKSGSAHLIDSAYNVLRKNLMPVLKKDRPNEYYRFIIRSYYLSSFINKEKNLLEESEVELKRAIDLFQDYAFLGKQVGQLYSALTVVYNSLNDLSSYEVWCKKSIEHALKIGDRELEANSYAHLGGLYMKQYKISLAQESYKYALHVDQAALKKSGIGYININNALGTLFTWQEEYDSALYYYRKLEDYIFTELPKVSSKNVVQYYKAVLYNNLSNIYTKKSELTIALDYSKKSLSINESLYGQSSSQLIRNLKQLGKIYQNSEEYHLAEIHLTRSLKISKATQHDLIFSYCRLGDLYQDQNFLNKAELYYDSALVAANIRLTEYKDPQLNFKSRDALAALTGKIQVEAKKEDNNLQQVNSLYLKFAHVAQILFEETDSKAIFDRIPIALEDLFSIYERAYNKTKDKRYLERLWEISDINKSKKLRGQLKREYVAKNTLSESSINRLKQLKDSINLITSHTNPEKFDSTLFKLKARQTLLMSQVQKNHPRYHSLINENTLSSLQDYQNRLMEKEVVFNFTEGVNRIFALRISSEEVKILHISKPDFKLLINQHNKAILNNWVESEFEVSESILRTLLLGSKQLEKLEKITIIPDGMVWGLNFNALAVNTKHRVQYIGNLKQVSLKYSHSEVQRDRYKMVKPKLAAFSFNKETDATQVGKTSLFRNINNSIPGTSKEVLAISDILDGKYFFAQKANESVFRNESKNYGILHLAIHGFQDEQKPANSFLKFTKADSLNDGKLHAYEIYNMSLNADLAVLSACHSGNGKFVAGEGMMSIGRAFSYAGVKSLLISRWEVSDYSAPHLMKYFYQGLKKGMYKSEALRYAQNQYLENHSDELTSSPFFWSSFYVLGDDSPIYEKARINEWLIGLLVIVFLTGMGGLIRKRRRSKMAA